MKKLFTLIILLSSVLIGKSQSIVLYDVNYNDVTNGVINIVIAPSSNTTTPVLVHNSTNQPRTYKVRRSIITMAADDSTQYCWGGYCYTFGTNLSPHTATLAAMDTLDFAGGGFHAIFVSGLSSMCRLVNYHFYDPNNVNDSSSVTIRYCSTLGVNELASNANTVSDAFPNPATSVVSVKYNVNTDTGKSYIALYNVLGNELKQIALTTKQGETKINTDELDNGIYFYSLITDHKIVATKKLVVSH